MKLFADVEMMLMGFVVPVTNEDIVTVTKRILEVVRSDDYNGQEEAEEVKKNIFKYDRGRNYTVRYMVVNTTCFGDTQITYLIDVPEHHVPKYDVKDLDGEEYFSYVYNITNPHFSELGYTYYEFGRDHRIHRMY